MAALRPIPGMLEQLRLGTDLLALGCGEGADLNDLAGRFTRSRFTGIDRDPGAIDQAAAEAMLLGLRNVAYRELEPTALREREAYDLIGVAAAVPDAPDVGRVIRVAAGALRPRGQLVLLLPGPAPRHGEDGDPLAPILQSLALIEAGAGAPRVAPAPPRRTLRRLLRDAGFRRLRTAPARGADGPACIIATMQ